MFSSGPTFLLSSSNRLWVKSASIRPTKKVLELARRLLVKELALAEGIEEDMVTERLENMVN